MPSRTLNGNLIRMAYANEEICPIVVNMSDESSSSLSSGSGRGSGTSFDSGVAWTSATDSGSGCNYGTTATNDLGRRERISSTPHRITSLSSTEKSDQPQRVSGKKKLLASPPLSSLSSFFTVPFFHLQGLIK